MRYETFQNEICLNVRSEYAARLLVCAYICCKTILHSVVANVFQCVSPITMWFHIDEHWQVDVVDAFSCWIELSCTDCFCKVRFFNLLGHILLISPTHDMIWARWWFISVGRALFFIVFFLLKNNAWSTHFVWIYSFVQNGGWICAIYIIIDA